MDWQNQLITAVKHPDSAVLFEGLWEYCLTSLVPNLPLTLAGTPVTPRGCGRYFIWDFPAPEPCLECTQGTQGCCEHQLCKCWNYTETFSKSLKPDWIKWWGDQKINRGRRNQSTEFIFVKYMCVCASI